MIELIKLFLGKLPAKIQLAILIVGLVGYGVWWMTDEWGEMKTLIEVQKVEIADKQKAIITISQAHGELNEKYIQLERDYAAAITRFNELQTELAEAQDRYNDNLQVFKKKEDRFNDLFQKRTSLIVKRANRATERMREQLETAISSDGLQERENQNTMPSSAEIKPR